jgi:glycosyltransferase involved in cell wall biosynthesis
VLLEAWERAEPNGSLILAGPIDAELRIAYSSTLSRPDVKELGHVKDIASVYAAADVFVFPSHEEGGPQVIYEAAGCGLPSIVSPMGAGRIARDGIECVMVNPLSVDDVAASLTRMAESEPLRRSLGTAARARAQEFTWSKAGMHLYRQFEAAAGRQAHSTEAAEVIPSGPTYQEDQASRGGRVAF